MTPPRKPRVLWNCTAEGCTEVLELLPSETLGKKYCSRKCSSRSFKTWTHQKKLSKKCGREQCENVITDSESQLWRRIYCGRECWYIVNRENYAATPTVWDNFARRYRRDHDVGTVCLICGEEEYSRRVKSHHLDHDHKTGVVRGLLCQGCNLHLGRWEQVSEFFLSGVWVDTEFVYRASGPLIQLYRDTLDSTDCRCCGKSEFFDRVKRHCVDHNPLTGFIRGILCVTCNGTLGWYENNRDAVEGYLSRGGLGGPVFKASGLACA